MASKMKNMLAVLNRNLSEETENIKSTETTENTESTENAENAESTENAENTKSTENKKKAKNTASLTPKYGKTSVSVSNPVGLSSVEAERRLAQYGKNVLAAKKQKSALRLFAGQYKDIMTIILLVCTAVSLFMGEYVEALAIAVIVLMNGLLGFIQEYKTEKTLEALKGMASPTARVFRDKVIVALQASELTLGDVVVLEAGDRIPTDGKLLDSTALACDEAMLTGESVPVKKSVNSSLEKERELYMGCIVTKGHCRYEVTAVGMKTEMGHIAAMLQTIAEEATPLQKKLASLSKYIAVGCLLVCFIVSVTGILRGEPFLQMLITGVSLAVAAVPEGLPAIVTISLALSVSRMVKRNALVRRLHAVETLGCATVICTDKTGTITENKMTATTVFINGSFQKAEGLDKSEPATKLLFTTITLCNNAILFENGKEDFGGHTELALLRLAKQHGVTASSLSENNEAIRISEQPFDSDRKRMSVVIQDSSLRKTMLCKGAFDLLLDRCSYYQSGGSVLPLTLSLKRELTQKNAEMADDALRVIAAAYKPISQLSSASQENSAIQSEREEDLVFLGQIGMIDPPRKTAKKAVFECHKAGIKTIMITGDHKNTAVAIAKQVGIFHEGDLSITGEELDEMSLDRLSSIIHKVTVFARVNPNHKLQIVRALKRGGHIVAMTGDGVNDAPAIKESDIGVSMGDGGSDVAKEASEIILLDDNFATLVGAISEGRSIYNNIRKFIRYLLSCNIGEVITMFVGMLMGMPVILLPIQILLINLVTDGFPAIALGLEPSDPRAMSALPRKPNESVFSHGLAGKIIFRGLLIGLSTLASFVSLFKASGSIDVARSGALFALIFAQLIHVFECKSEEKSLLAVSYLNNKKLLLAVAGSLFTLLAVLYFPPLAAIFSTTPLTAGQLLTPIVFCMIAPIANIFLCRKK